MLLWEDVYADKKYEPSPEAERHRRKYEHIKDGFNRRWKECVNFGRWITADESRLAGWYKSGITIVLEVSELTSLESLLSKVIVF